MELIHILVHRLLQQILPQWAAVAVQQLHHKMLEMADRVEAVEDLQAYLVQDMDTRHLHNKVSPVVQVVKVLTDMMATVVEVPVELRFRQAQVAVKAVLVYTILYLVQMLPMLVVAVAVVILTIQAD
jgi:hypothetical protein